MTSRRKTAKRHETDLVVLRFTDLPEFGLRQRNDYIVPIVKVTCKVTTSQAMWVSGPVGGRLSQDGRSALVSANLGGM